MARIILIDDEDAVRRTVRLALITDIFMPGQDGIVTVRRIRKESPVEYRGEPHPAKLGTAPP